MFQLVPVPMQIFADLINIGIYYRIVLIAGTGGGKACPEDNSCRFVYSALEKAGRPQIFGKTLASFPVMTICEIEPPLRVLLKMGGRAAQPQFTTAWHLVANQQSACVRPEPFGT